MNSGTEITPATQITPRTQITYSHVCFSKAGLSANTILRITNDSVYICDPTDGYTITFDGGSLKYSITITNSEIKKRKYKTITIKRLMPLCPISGQPVIEVEMAPKIGYIVYNKSPDRGAKFLEGYAYNCFNIGFNKPSSSHNPALYYLIDKHRPSGCMVYLVVPIVDGRLIQPAIIDTLYKCLGNMDVIDIIASYYNQLAKRDLPFNYHMRTDTPIKLNTLYHRRGLIDLFHQGHLKLGIVNDDYIGYNYMGSILILEPSAYNFISPFGKKSVLTHMFTSCQQMMDFREKLIAKYLV